MPSFNPETELGAFIPTTDIYDVDNIYDLDVKSQEFKDFLVRIRQNINNVAMLLNIKDTGYYPTTEFVCSKSWFPNPNLTAATANKPQWRQVFRKTFILGALPVAGTATIAHGINYGTDYPVTFTDIYGTANDTVNFRAIPLPFIGPGSNPLWGNVSIDIDANNINITVTADMSSFDTGYLVLEFIKE